MKKPVLAILVCLSVGLAIMPGVKAGGGGNSNAADEARRQAAEAQKRADELRMAEMAAKEKAAAIAKAQAEAWAIAAQAAALAQSDAYVASQRGKPQEPETVSHDFPAIQYLKPGVIVAIRSNMLHKYIKVEGNTLKTTGTSSADPACQFEILRSNESIGFRSVLLRKNNGDKSILYLRSDLLTTGPDSPNFAGDSGVMWEQFSIQTNDEHSLSKLFFFNKAAKAYLTTYFDLSAFPAELQAGAPEYLKKWTQTLGGAQEPNVPATHKTLAQEFSLEIVANLPTGFRYEDGKLEHVACGSDLDGNLIAYGIDNDGDVLRYNVHETSGKQPWNEIDFKLPDGTEVSKIEHIALGCDGTGLVLANKGLPYLLDVATHTITPLAIQANGVNFEDCAMAHKHKMWALDADNMALYHMVKNEFVKIEAGNATALAVGIDGTVVKLDKDHKPWILDKSNSTPTSLLWSPLGNNVLNDIAIADKTNIVGIRDNGSFVKFQNGTWVDVKGADGQPTIGLEEVAINAGNTTIILTASGAIAMLGDHGVVLDKKARAMLEDHGKKKAGAKKHTAGTKHAHANADIDANDEDSDDDQPVKRQQHGKKHAAKKQQHAGARQPEQNENSDDDQPVRAQQHGKTHAAKKQQASAAYGKQADDEDNDDNIFDVLGLTAKPAKPTRPTRATADIPVTPGVKTKYVEPTRRATKQYGKRRHVNLRKKRKLVKKHVKASGQKKRVASAKKAAGKAAKPSTARAAARKVPLHKKAVVKVKG